MKTSLKVILAFAMIMVPSVASAQVYVGGSISGSYSDTPSDGTKAKAFDIRPEVGYVLNSDWAFGARLSYGKSQTVVDTPTVHNETTNVNLFTISPYASYSVLSFAGLSLLAEAGLNLAPKQDGSEGAFGAYFAPVLTYDLSRHFLLRTSINILGASVMWADGGFAFSAGVDSNDIITVGNGLSVGFVYKF